MLYKLSLNDGNNLHTAGLSTQLLKATGGHRFHTTHTYHTFSTSDCTLTPTHVQQFWGEHWQSPTLCTASRTSYIVLSLTRTSTTTSTTRDFLQQESADCDYVLYSTVSFGMIIPKLNGAMQHGSRSRTVHFQIQYTTCCVGELHQAEHDASVNTPPHITYTLHFDVELRRIVQYNQVIRPYNWHCSLKWVMKFMQPSPTDLGLCRIEWLRICNSHLSTHQKLKRVNTLEPQA